MLRVCRESERRRQQRGANGRAKQARQQQQQQQGPEGVARVQRMQQVYRDGAARMAAVAANHNAASTGAQAAGSQSQGGRAVALQLHVPRAEVSGAEAGGAARVAPSGSAHVSQGATSMQGVNEPMRASSRAAVAALDSLNDAAFDDFSDTDSINEGEVDELLAWTNGLGDAI